MSAVLPATRRPPKRKAPPFRLSAEVPREHPLQVQIAKLLAIEIAPAGRVSAEGVCWFAIDHADFAGAVPAARVGRGIVAGIPDLFLLWNGRAHFIEIKAEDGALRDTQRSIAAAVIAASGRVGVAARAEHVLDCLDAWDIPRHRRTRL